MRPFQILKAASIGCGADALERAPGRVLDGATVDQGVGGAGDLLERDVRLPHQLLDAQLAAGLVGIAERLREAALVVERQPIVAASGGVVQLVAQAPEEIARRARRRHLAVRQEPPLAGLPEPGELVPHASDPEGRLQVAQTSLALLQVRLEQPDRSAIARRRSLNSSSLSAMNSSTRRCSSSVTVRARAP